MSGYFGSGWGRETSVTHQKVLDLRILHVIVTYLLQQRLLAFEGRDLRPSVTDVLGRRKAPIKNHPHHFWFGGGECNRKK